MFNFAFGGDFDEFPHRGFGGMNGGMGGERRSKNAQQSSDTKFYDALGLERTASDADIKKAFRKAAMQHHPDKGGDPEKFKEITKAYEVLSDAEKKKLYDQFGEEGLENGGGGPSAGPMDIFDLFMGGGMRAGTGERSGRGGRRKGEDVVFPLRVGLDELYNGTTKKLRLTKNIICPACSGRGGRVESSCRTCHGRGVRMVIRQLGPGMIQQMQMQCNDCNGEGVVIPDKDKCKKCDGAKTIKDKKTLEVFVKKGVTHGQRIVFNGEGDEAPDIVPGDVIVVIQQNPHPILKREGTNLYMKKTLHLVEALTSFEFIIPHLDGRSLLVKSDPKQVVRPGDWKAIRNEGMPDQKNPFLKGNLYIEFEIKFPDAQQLTEQHRAALIAILGKPTPIPLSTSTNGHHKNHSEMDMEGQSSTSASSSSSSSYSASDVAEEVFLVDVDIHAERSRYESANRESFSEEDEERRHQGHHGAGCRQQ